MESEILRGIARCSNTYAAFPKSKSVLLSRADSLAFGSLALGLRDSPRAPRIARASNAYALFPNCIRWKFKLHLLARLWFARISKFEVEIQITLTRSPSARSHIAGLPKSLNPQYSFSHIGKMITGDPKYRASKMQSFQSN